jgi:protein ImuA
MPGLGFARWNVELLKVRNGKPGSWQIEWGPTGFRTIPASIIGLPQHNMSNTG